MAGTSSSSIRWGAAVETVPGTTNANPAFAKTALDNITMGAPPNVNETRSNAAGRRRSGVARSGFTVTGTGTGGLIYGEYDDYLASLFQGTWTSDVLKDTVTQQTSFTFENTSPAGVGGTDTYFRYRGVEVTGGSITLAAEQNAAVEFNFEGTAADDATETAIVGATYTDPASDVVLGSGADIGFITMSGFAQIPCFNQMTINFNIEDKERQARIFSDELCGMARGAMLPILNADLFIEPGVLQIYNAARSGVEFAVTLPIGTVSGSKYMLEFPRCQMTTADPNPDANSYFQQVTILPLFSAADDAVAIMTRAVA